MQIDNTAYVLFRRCDRNFCSQPVPCEGLAVYRECKGSTFLTIKISVILVILLI